MPERFHDSNTLPRVIAELGALPVVRERQRLMIGDALISTLGEAMTWPYWRDSIEGNSIFVSFDPVAMDTMALRYWCQLKTEHGDNIEAPTGLASRWLKNGSDLGSGTNDIKYINYQELKLR
jgi:hypothetical protein